MKTAVDSSVLLDVLDADVRFGERSREALRAAYDGGRLWRASRGGREAARDRVVADFIVGAHAALQAETLLTRDRGFYRRYFQIKVTDPGEA